MSLDRTGEYKIEEKHQWQSGLFRSSYRLQSERAFRQPAKLALQSFYRRLMMGLGRLIVVGKYAWSNRSLGVRRPGFPFRMTIPWWKVGLVVLAVFIVLKKDIQLSLNLKSPLGAAPKEEEEAASMNQATAFNMAQSIAWAGGKEKGDTRTRLDPKLVSEYVGDFGDLAVSEMQKFGIPASIQMAQAILGSRAGTDPQVRQEHNHFGAALAGTRYDNAWHNWREHSLLLYHEYPELFSLDNDYRRWARQLEKLGYDQQRDYGDRLIEVIERHQLDRLDAYR